MTLLKRRTHDLQEDKDMQRSNTLIILFLFRGWNFIRCIALCFIIVFLISFSTQRKKATKPRSGYHHVRKQDRKNVRYLQFQPTIQDRHSGHTGTTKSTNAKGEEDTMIDMRVLNQRLKFDNPYGGVWTQGWELDPVPLDPLDPIVVYVLPHSHCDPGWLKTFEEYYLSETSNILTTVYASLMKDSRRKFIWAEVSYFERWWRDQNQTTREDMRGLIENKQLEFVTGGWVMPDEANSQKYAIEMQLQEGHDWLRSTFGNMSIPKYGWSIDPFGYSPTMAYVLKTHGFKGMLIQRVHYAIKKELAKQKHLEFYWRQTWDDNAQYDIFTHMMPFLSYDQPHSCGPDPKICCQFDFGRLNGQYWGCWWGVQPVPITAENVAERAHLLLDQYQKKASLYRSRVVLAPLGDDFRYPTIREAEDQYNNYQRLFDYMNNNIPGVKIQFGTLSEYFEAVKGKYKPPYLKGSFYTYADSDENYWSGYFTSRVFDKSLDRVLEQTIYAAESMGATKEELQPARRALSLFQHHDGITGTSKPHVVRDFATRLQSGIDFAHGWMANKITGDVNANKPLAACLKSDDIRGLRFDQCDQDLETYLYNPLPYDRTCGDIIIPALNVAVAPLPCEHPNQTLDRDANYKTKLHFDSNGMMVHPFREEWKVWQVSKGGAYLFFPDTLKNYDSNDVKIKLGGYIVETPNWRRTIIEHIPLSDGTENDIIVLDFIYEVNLKKDDEEWIVRFSSDVNNEGILHTDLNGFNFDTHVFRDDLPTQSQVFSMPTMASIENSTHRFTVLSEHSQGAASLKEGAIDVWLDRRLSHDDWRGLGEGVRDNVLSRSHFRVMLEVKNDDKRMLDSSSSDSRSNDNSSDIQKTYLDFKPTPFCRRMWEDLNHPFEIFGTLKESIMVK